MRENLRLRLLSARLALLARDEAGYREDLRTAQRWIPRYFDPRSKQTADALNQLKQLSSTTVSFELPSITESLEAVAATSRGANAARDEAAGMRSLFWLLVVFAAAVALVIVGRIDSGYVLLIYPPYRVEVSMLFFAIASRRPASTTGTPLSLSMAASGKC